MQIVNEIANQFADKKTRTVLHNAIFNFKGIQPVNIRSTVPSAI
jgi:hypothetical protein